MTATKNAEITEQKDREKHAMCNIFIHRREESVHNESDDVKFFDEFMTKVCVRSHAIKSVKQIGKRENNMRTLLVSFYYTTREAKSYAKLKKFKRLRILQRNKCNRRTIQYTNNR